MTTQQDEQFDLLILTLRARLGRFPTEDEVIEFINGDEATRQEIWNKA